MTDGDAAFIAFERLAMSVAHRLVKAHDTFHPLPRPDGYGGQIVGWLRNLGRKGISQQAATAMLNEDLHDAMQALRAKVAAVGHERLGSARTGVMLYLALLPGLGAERVLAWSAIWLALKEERWDDAADALLMTEWPKAEQAATLTERARAVALQRVLRSGNQFDQAQLERKLQQAGAP